MRQDEKHTDRDQDLFCDICEADLCNHWLSNLVSNEDNTHTGLCNTCKRTITEDCDETFGIYADDTAEISGGVLSINAGETGIEAGHVILSGGLRNFNRGGAIGTHGKIFIGTLLKCQKKEHA